MTHVDGLPAPWTDANYGRADIPRTLGVASGCSARVTNMAAPTSRLQHIKHKPADQPAIKHAKTMPHLRVASAEPPWLDKTHFEKKTHILARCFVRYYRTHYVIKVLILWFSQRRFLRLCIDKRYNKALHTYINVCRYVSPQWKHCTNCVHGLATGLTAGK